jgi:DNA-binding transcriptional MerR regulator
MSIGEVLAALRPDFPDVTISKIRFLEAEGLVDPERTPSGYRKFTHRDLDRLRYVLTAQREQYLPLRVIRDHLDAFDRGLVPPEPGGGAPRVPPHLVAVDGLPGPESFSRGSASVRLSRRELIDAAEIDTQLLRQLEEYGLLAPRGGSQHAGGHYDADALLVARTAAELAAFGLEARHLRAFKAAAEREAGLVEQVVTPLRRARGADARARADEVVRELAALSVQLHAALVKTALRIDG